MSACNNNSGFQVIGPHDEIVWHSEHYYEIKRNVKLPLDSLEKLKIELKNLSELHSDLSRMMIALSKLVNKK